MKYFIIALLIGLFQIHLFSQEITRITNKDKNTNSLEIYHVLKSDKNIKHGLYQKVVDKSILVVEGYYKNGFKDSLWTNYKFNSKSLKSRGTYLKDEQIGDWEFYNFKGELEQKYDFSKNEIVYFKEEKENHEKTYKIINERDTVENTLDNPPLFIGGSIKMNNEFIRHIRYPELAMENGTQGTVNVVFTVDQNGIARDHRVLKEIGSGCDEEAIRVIKLIPNNWYPAQLNGKRVNVEHSFPINFILH
ncbi:energy transducer TonB [Brumimicrobium mesophilum]|uniref:energy transducer TonB n=1 Tax=Brumimicrobium mesophilum TaxID=392717 RepID=UPI000D14090C|nr:energy transducer TonB [Brumimicrobium mesophilum]